MNCKSTISSLAISIMLIIGGLFIPLRVVGETDDAVDEEGSGLSINGTKINSTFEKDTEHDDQTAHDLKTNLAINWSVGNTTDDDNWNWKGDIIENETLKNDSNNNGGGMGLDYDPPRMEICSMDYGPNDDSRDGKVWYQLTVKYRDETSSHLDHILAYVSIQIRAASDNHLLSNTVTQANGTTPWCWMGLDPGDSWNSYIKVFMNDGRPDNQACGFVQTIGGSDFYGQTSSYFMMDTKYYQMVLILGDTDHQSGQSYVGAAVVYDLAQQSKALIDTVDGGSTNPKIIWDVSGSISCSAYDGTNNKIELVGFLLMDETYQNQIDVGMLQASHEYGHCIFYNLAFEHWKPGSIQSPHYFDREHPTLDDAWNEALGTLWWLKLNNSDFYPFDALCTGNQNHLESRSFDDAKEASNIHFIRGQYVEAAIAMMLWDTLDTQASSDQSPNQDDDGLDNSILPGDHFQHFWWVLDFYNVHDVYSFWDHFQQLYPNLDDELDQIYFQNNIGRYRYHHYDGPSGQIQNLVLTRFEVWGNNPTCIMNQKVMVRYVLKNSGQQSITFDNQWGILVAARYPPGGQGQNCDFGHSFKGGVLESGWHVGSTQVKTMDEVAGNYLFWPWFNINGAGYGWDTFPPGAVLPCAQYPFEEDFEGDFPSTGWTCDDLNPTSGKDYWDDTSSKARSGYWSCWCAQIGNHAQGVYDNYMEAVMTFQADLRYINLKIDFYYQQDIEAGFDYFELRGWDADNSQWIPLQTFSSDASDWIHVQYNIDGAGDVYSGGSSMKIQFFFYSDWCWYYAGTFVDAITFLG